MNERLYRYASRGKGKRNQQKMRIGRGFGNGHPPGQTPMRADKGNNRLHDGNNEGEDEGKVTEFCNHSPSIGAKKGQANAIPAPLFNLSQSAQPGPVILPLLQDRVFIWL